MRLRGGGKETVDLCNAELRAHLRNGINQDSVMTVRQVATVIQSASRETDVFEMDVTEQVEGVEVWVGGQLNSSSHAISVAVMPQWTLKHRVFAYDSFVKKW